MAKNQPMAHDMIAVKERDETPVTPVRHRQSVPIPHSSICPYLIMLRDKATLVIWAYFDISKYDFRLSLFAMPLKTE